ncbi:MAG: aromatic ring-hydroxylating dioxygenase subunit alpha [Acidimicrobiales bacterium]
MTERIEPAEVLIKDIGTLRSRAEGSGPTARRPITIPADRYYSTAFADRETDYMWPRVWQLATSIDAVSEPGDWIEFSVGALSAIVLRDQEGTLRAFQNVCMHRGVELCNGSGSDLTELRCGFHRWCWNLDGTLSEIPSRRDFGVIDNDAYGLAPVLVDTWGPLVFINFDVNAMSLAAYLGGAPADAAYLGMDEFHCRFEISVKVPANWKTAADGFSETYHVQGLHPELLKVFADLDNHQVFWEHVGRSRQLYGIPSPRIRPTPTDQEVWEAFASVYSARAGLDAVNPGPVPVIVEGSDLFSVMANCVREAQAAKGVDLSAYTDMQIMMMDQHNVFPNITVLLHPDLLSVLRTRPGDHPDECWLDIFNFERAGAKAPRTKPMKMEAPLDAMAFGTVFNQDFEMLRTAQRGLHQPGFTRITLSQEESRILNNQLALERYLAISPSEIEGDFP